MSSDEPSPPPGHVTGIGGVFFRARDPAALARWYANHLGIDPVPASYEERPWWQQQGPTVFSPFPADSDAFGRPEQAWMLNLRVRDLGDTGREIDLRAGLKPSSINYGEDRDG